MTDRALSREILGYRFQNPILLAAGTAGFGRELDRVVDLDLLGGLITKAVSREPRSGNPAPRVAEFPGGMLNSVGLANPGLDQVVGHDLPWLAQRLTHTQVLVNVVGNDAGEFAEVVRGLEPHAGFMGVELNLSCPNTAAGGIEFGSDVGSVREVVSRCRAETRKPLFVKLSPVLPDITGMVEVARDNGADGVSLINTFPGMALDQGGSPRLGSGHGGVSGPALLALGVLAVARVARRMTNFPVIGVGGVRTADEVRQYLRAGASLVAIGTAALAHPRLPERLLRELERDGV